MQDIIDRRVGLLYDSGGMSIERPRSLVYLARALMGQDHLHFVDDPGAGGAAVCAISRRGCHIYLRHDASAAENHLTLARGIARWDALREGGLSCVEDVAMTVALPTEALAILREEGCDAREIARIMCFPIEVVTSRSEDFERGARSERRLRTPSLVAALRLVSSG